MGYLRKCHNARKVERWVRSVEWREKAYHRGTNEGYILCDDGELLRSFVLSPHFLRVRSKAKILLTRNERSALSRGPPQPLWPSAWWAQLYSFLRGKMREKNHVHRTRFSLRVSTCIREYYFLALANTRRFSAKMRTLFPANCKNFCRKIWRYWYSTSCN